RGEWANLGGALAETVSLIQLALVADSPPLRFVIIPHYPEKTAIIDNQCLKCYLQNLVRMAGLIRMESTSFLCNIWWAGGFSSSPDSYRLELGCGVSERQESSESCHPKLADGTQQVWMTLAEYRETDVFIDLLRIWSGNKDF
ncbi:hypothetical protein, partial [Acidithiobacillus thiooxidans]|uniref:hypothetical protein n=1 Tax=Acidithiobacillus thiooxidans TaxID=930 RepID=UPI001A7E17AB